MSAATLDERTKREILGTSHWLNVRRKKGGAMPNTLLSEEEVRQRLSLCDGNSDVVNELYDFGQTLGAEVIDRIRAVESKATSFAAYGAAIVTFLVTSVAIWSRLGNQWSPWISVCAGFCGLMCTYFSLRVLALREYEWISEDDWLKTECLSNLNTLKQYRILTMWGVIHSHGKIRSQKARELRRAQIWLAGSVVYLVYLLLHVAFLRSFDNSYWMIPLWHRVVPGCFGVPGWEHCGGCGGLLILGLTLAFIIRRAWLVRLI